MTYRVEKTALNASGKMYQPGDVLPDSVVEEINPKNLKILFAEGVITKDGFKVEAPAEVAPPSLESGDPEISLVAEESTISPAELAAELIKKRGNDGAPERTEEDVLREMEEIKARPITEDEGAPKEFGDDTPPDLNDEELQKELDGTLLDGLDGEDEGSERDSIKAYHKQKRKEHPEDYEDSELGLDGEDEELLDDDEE